MLTTVPLPRVVGTSLQRDGGCSRGGWRGAGRGGSSTAEAKKVLPPVTSPVLPVCSKHSFSPAFQPAEEPVVPHGCPSWKKTKGRCLPACQAAPGSRDALHPRFLPPAPPLCLCSSGSWGPGARFHGLCGRWGAGECLVGLYKLACAEQNSVYLCSSCLRFLPAGAAAFWRHPGGLSVPWAGRSVKDVHDGER